MPPAKKVQPGLRNLTALAKMMDAQFKVPGTNIRFGIDALVGLVPGVGDFVTFLISGFLVTSAVKKGASGFVVARMLLNTIIDTVIGAIPVLGDIFDVAFKANQRNIQLLQQHYTEGRHGGSAKKVVVPVIIVLSLLLAGFIWLAYRTIVWLF